MEYILSGDPHEVAKVIQENRIRISRGVIKFTPAVAGGADDAVDDGDVKEVTIEDTKEVTAVDTKAVASTTKKTTRRTKKSE